MRKLMSTHTHLKGKKEQDGSLRRPGNWSAQFRWKRRFQKKAYASDKRYQKSTAVTTSKSTAWLQKRRYSTKSWLPSFSEFIFIFISLALSKVPKLREPIQFEALFNSMTKIQISSISSEISWSLCKITLCFSNATFTLKEAAEELMVWLRGLS